MLGTACKWQWLQGTGGRVDGDGIRAHGVRHLDGSVGGFVAGFWEETVTRGRGLLAEPMDVALWMMHWALLESG